MTATGNPGTDGAKRAETRRPLNLQPSPRVRSTTRKRSTGMDTAMSADAAEQTLVDDGTGELARETGLVSDRTLEVSDSQLPPVTEDVANATTEPDAPNAVDPARPDTDSGQFEPDQIAVTATLGLDAGVTLGTVRDTSFQNNLDQIDATIETGNRSADRRVVSGSNRPAPPDAQTITQRPTHAGGDNSTSSRLAALAAGGDRSGDRRYQVAREIARGGMGAIMIARDHDLRREVAMKVLLGTRQKDADTDRKSRGRVARFLEEAQITGQLEHPNIVPVHDLGVDAGGRLFFTMKLVNGEALSEILSKLQHQLPGESPYKGFSRARLLEVFSKVCDAVAYAHSRGVVHRDLKPANIMVGAFGEVMVMDWGIAKIIRQDGTDTDARGTGELRAKPGVARMEAGTSSRRSRTLGATAGATGETPQIESERASDGAVVTMDGAVIGTPAYMAPEQARGEIDQISERTDVYALGAILYEILTLHPPYEGSTPIDVLKRVQTGRGFDIPERRAPERDVPAELSAICMKALSRHSRARYESVEALHQDLTRWQDGLPVSVYRDTTAGRTIKWMKRHKLQTAVLAAALLIAVTMIVSLSLTLEAKARQLAEAQNAAEANKRAITAEQAARDMAASLAELDRIRLTVRSGAGLDEAASALVDLRDRAPGLYPAAFELQRVLDMLGRDGEGTAVLESLRDNEAAPDNVRAQASLTLGMRVLERTQLSHPDAVDDLTAARPHFQWASEHAEAGTPMHVATTALHAVAYAAVAPDARAINDANNAAEEAVRACPTMWEPWYALARARALPATPVRRTDKAPSVNPAAVVLACNKVLAVEPGSFATWRLRARYTLDWDDILVLREYEASVASELIESHVRRLDGDATRALDRLRQLAGADDANGWVWLELAECGRVVGDYRTAMEAVDKAIIMLPDANVPRRVRARILIELNGNQQALERALTDLNEVLDRDPNNLPALGLRSMLQVRRSSLHNAQTDLTTYIANHPTAAAYDARAAIRMALGDIESAFVDWQKCVDLQPDRFMAWTILYRCLWAAGQYQRALEVMDGAEACAPDALRASMAQERTRLQEADEKVRLWEQAYGQKYQTPPATLRQYGQIAVQNIGETIHHELAMTAIELNRLANGRRLGIRPEALPGSELDASVANDNARRMHDDRFAMRRNRGRMGHGGGGDTGGTNAEPEASPQPGPDGRDRDEEEAEDKLADRRLREKLEQMEREVEHRQQQMAAQMERQWSRGSVQRSAAASMGFNATDGLAVLLGGKAPNAAEGQQKLAQASQVIRNAVESFKAAGENIDNDSLNVLRAYGLIAQSEGYVLTGHLLHAARAIDNATATMTLDPMYAYYGAAIYMKLATDENRGADAPSVEACYERAMGYLESAVLRGLPDADRHARHALFAPLFETDRFKALFG